MEQQLKPFWQQHPVVSFIILAYLLPAPILILRWVDLQAEPLLIYASWTPNIAAFLVTAFVLREKGGIRKLAVSWAKWKVGLRWYLVALSPFLIAFLVAGIGAILGLETGPAQEPIPLFLLISLVISILTGALGEELGWRGFLLPRIQQRYSGFIASLIVGVIWALWHLPLWALPGQGWDVIPYWAFAFVTISSSVLFTFVFRHTDGSLVMASLIHFSMNYGISLVSILGWLPAPENAWPIASGIYVLYALVLVAVFGSDFRK